MIRAVIVSGADLSQDLAATVLFRNNVERLSARSARDVHRHAQQSRVDVVIVDSALPGAAGLVAALRQDPLTRPTAIVGLARSSFSFGSLDLIQAGANAILPMPPGPDWDDRLIRLVHVPIRKTTQLAVDLAVEGGLRGGVHVSGRLLNLSVHGMLVACGDPLEIGDDLRFTFVLPQALGSVYGTGTIVRQASDGFGVELTSVEGDGRTRIKRYVESIAG